MPIFIKKISILKKLGMLSMLFGVFELRNPIPTSILSNKESYLDYALIMPTFTKNSIFENKLFFVFKLMSK